MTSSHDLFRTAGLIQESACSTMKASGLFRSLIGANKGTEQFDQVLTGFATLSLPRFQQGFRTMLKLGSMIFVSIATRSSRASTPDSVCARIG